jgi:hypothetical protein
MFETAANKLLNLYYNHEITEADLGKYQWKVYHQLLRKYDKAAADAEMARRLVTDLHPSQLCQRDFDCWISWEARR